MNMYNRELSWLSFNHRVLQEAEDKRNPLFERLKFLAIYSSNLDEFFRVRVASLKSLLEYKEKAEKKLGVAPDKLLRSIHTKVKAQQEQFGKIFYETLIPELNSHHIFFADYKNLLPEHSEFIETYFMDNVIEHIQPVLLLKNKIFPFLQNHALYLIVQLCPKGQSNGSKRYKYAQIKIPRNYLPRFIELPEVDGKRYVIFLDDLVRANLGLIFQGYDIVTSYLVKLTRDASIDLEDGFSDSLKKAIEKGIKKRNTGLPSRFLYDQSMPKHVLNLLKNVFHLRRDDLISGGRYHNFSDFFGFPNFGEKSLELPTRRTIPSKRLESNPNILKSLAKQDELLIFPYQSFDYFIQFLKAVVNEKTSKTIYITLYRVANDSKVVRELINACKRGINVIVLVEIKARFDEESNLKSAEMLVNAGAKVMYGFKNFKVHTKVCLVETSSKKHPFYAYLGTGNFNEKTSKIYSDIGLFTTDTTISSDIKNVFNYLQHPTDILPEINRLIVAPFNIRETFYTLLETEISNAKAGKFAQVIAKMNSLEDKEMIKRLYKAAKAGVKIKLIIRGICCLIPQKNIEIISIVGQYLEHARAYIFENEGNTLCYVGSADWMKRNLSKRVEILFPINEPVLKRRLLSYISIQLNDTSKARKIDRYQKNEYVQSDQKQLNSYDETFVMLKAENQ